MFKTLKNALSKSNYSIKDYKETRINKTILTRNEISALLSLPLNSAKIRDQHYLTRQGDFQSVYRGIGVEFEELRPYQIGDDIRTIDWRATARANKPYVQVHRLEQQASILVYLDYSITMQFGTKVRLKLAQATRLAILLINKAYKKDIEVTVAIYNGKQTYYFRKSDAGNHTLGLIEIINNFYTASDIKINPKIAFHQALETILDRSYQYAQVYILSDFSHLSETLLPILANISNLRKLSLIRIYDKKEYKLPRVGRVVFFDTVNKHYLNIDTNSTQQYKELLAHMENRVLIHEKLINKIGLKFESCAANEDTHEFFIGSQMNV